MKNRILKITTALFAFVALIGCSTDNKVIDDVFEGVQKGAFLRITDVSGASIDLNNTASVFAISLEYQDGQGSTLLDRVEFGLTFNDNTTAGGDISTTGTLATVPSSSFSPGATYGLPQASYSFTYGEALTALGISQDQVEGEDSMIVTWTVFLTDGRSYSAKDANGNIAAIGGYYSSPFQYVTAFKCGLTDTSTLFNGDFEVTFDEWADYAEGELIPVIPDPTDPLSFRILSTNNIYINNPTTSWMTVTVVDEDGNVTVQGNEDFDYGPGFQLDVTGSGKINTCTGDIDLSIDFGSGFTGYGLTLKPAN